MIIEVASNNSINWKPETDIEKKINEIAGILKLRKGELAFMRDVGLSDDYIDSPVTKMRPVMINEIMTNIAEQVRDVTVKSIDIGEGNETGDFIIRVVCEV